jgi:hypothetical protein
MHKLQFFHRALARSLAKTNRVLEQAQLLFLTSYLLSMLHGCQSPNLRPAYTGKTMWKNPVSLSFFLYSSFVSLAFFFDLCYKHK